MCMTRILHNQRQPISSSLMATDIYPGKGLSLSQLAFALNEELRRVTHSPPCVTKDSHGLAQGRSTDSICPASPWIRFLNWTGTFRLHSQPSESGGTPLPASIAFRWTSFYSSRPTSPPNRTVFAPLSCAAIGAEYSSSMVHYGPSCTSEKARAMWRPSSNVPRGLS